MDKNWDKSLTRFGLREDGGIEHKEQRTPNCFVSALGLPLTVYILPRRLESGIKLVFDVSSSVSPEYLKDAHTDHFEYTSTFYNDI